MKSVFITGGIKSGKSNFALNLLQKKIIEKPFFEKHFIATLIPFDDEMKEKIRKHKEEREKIGIENLILHEEPVDLDNIVNDIKENSFILIDCITIWLNNLFYYEKDLDKIESIAFYKIENIFKNSNYKNKEIIFVSNEVNLGNIPLDLLTRRYNNLLGNINQKLASFSNEVYFMVSGIPLKIK